MAVLSPRKLHDNSVILFGNTMTLFNVARINVATNFFETFW